MFRFPPPAKSRSIVILAATAAMVLGLSEPGWAAATKHPGIHHPAAHATAPPAIAAGPGIDANGMPTFDVAAREAMVVDYNTGAILFEKDADRPMPTASLSKIMTAYVVFQYIKEGRAKLSDMLPVSKDAWRTGGSKMFVPYPGRVSIDDLIHGVLIQSGNDACVVLAEGLAGSTAAFVAQMNQEAKRLGLTHSHFGDVDGLPTPDHYMSPRDLITLAEHFIHDFPQYYHIVSEKEFTFNKIKQGNRNPLLYKNLGVDGIKTGHTDQAGYGLLASADRNGRRIIEVLEGMDSVNQRSREGEALLNWAYRSFDDVAVAKRGVAIDEAPVWFGVKPTVPVGTTSDATVTVPRGAGRKLKVRAIYAGQVKAPVAAGQPVGTLEVTTLNGQVKKFPLVTLAAVKQLGPVGRIADGIAHFIWDRKH